MIDQLLGDKYKIEAEMRAQPSSDALRRRYFEILYAIARSHFGIFFANFPEIATPLMFRGGGSDIFNLDQVFLQRQYDFDVPRPNTIMDLGAYVGYTAVLFANRFHGANIVAVEPPGPNFDCLTVNCAAYPNIRCLSGAVWYERTQMPASEYIFGDWGTMFEPVTGPSAGTEIAGYTINDILEPFRKVGI